MSEILTGKEISIGGPNSIKEFVNMQFNNCTFEPYNTEGISFNECTFNECSLQCFYLKETTFNGCTFSKCTFEQPIFIDVMFNKCWFIKSIISDEYSMEDVVFNQCTLIETTFRDKKIQKIDDSIEFDGCTFSKSNFIKYCLNGTQFENCVIRDGTLFRCGLTNTLICDTVVENCVLQDLFIADSEWDKVKFINCGWKDVTFGRLNALSNVYLRQTKVDNCGGDTESIHSLKISPYIFKTKQTHTPKLEKPLHFIPDTKKTHAPYRYISKGLI